MFGEATGALRVRSFRLFFIGAVISNSGSWLQVIGMGWVVKELAGDNYTLVGTATLLSSLPMAFTSLLGGTLADRFARRSILIVTQTLQLLLSVLIGLLWVLDVKDLWPYLVLGFVTGFVNGFHFPAWQAFISELVPRDLLMNAVTLNSAQFNAARLFGPALGGFTLALGGPSFTFFGNAVSYLAAIVAVWLLPGIRPEVTGRARPLQDLAVSARYLGGQPALRRCIALAVVTALLGLPVISMTVIFAQDVFEVGDVGYGLLLAALGAGSIVTTPFVAGVGPRRPPSYLVGLGFVTYGVGVLGFGLAPVYSLGLVALLVVGGAHLVVASTLNSVIQLRVDEHMRAKVISCYLAVLMLGQPLGAQAEGWLADTVGPRFAMGLAGVLLLMVAAGLGLTGGLRALDDERPRLGAPHSPRSSAPVTSSS